MRHLARRVLLGTCVAGAVGVSAAGAAGVADAAPAAPAAAAAPAAPGTAAYVPPSKNIYYGQSGAAVRSVQRRLAALHYYPGPIDGQYGPDTQEAVWAFKEVQGLPMNASNNSVMGAAFRHDLIHPKAPKVLVPKGGATRVEINLSIQVLVLYKDNEPNLILHISSGGNCLVDQGCGWVTPDGNYHALAFDPGWVTVPLGEMYNPVFFIGYEYAIHGDVPVPWYPVSHGCVRIWMDAAAFFHNRLTVGGSHATPVYVRGTAPYNVLADE